MCIRDRSKGLASWIDCARLFHSRTARDHTSFPSNEHDAARNPAARRSTHEESAQRMDFLLRLEQSGFATWVREGGTIWGYPFILFCHTLGLGTLAGVNGSMDLRILGFAPQVPLAPLKRFFPLLWGAFALTAASGSALLVADATTKLASPVF